MNKLDKDGCNYILKVPYESMAALEEKVYNIMSEAQSNADLKNCFIEINATHIESGQH